MRPLLLKLPPTSGPFPPLWVITEPGFECLVMQPSPTGWLFTCGNVCLHATLYIRLTPSSSPPPLSLSLFSMSASPEPVSLVSPALAGGLFTTSATWKI